MYNISVRRAGEDGYGLISQNGKVLEFLTADEARQWGKDFISFIYTTNKIGKKL